MLGRQRRRCASSRQFEIAIGLTSRQTKFARQRHGRLRHASSVRQQPPCRSQSVGLLLSRGTNHLTQPYYRLRRKSTAFLPRKPTIVRSKWKLSFAFREPSVSLAGSRAAVVRVLRPRSSVSSTGLSSHILIRCSMRRSTIRRATDLRSSACAMLPKEAVTDYAPPRHFEFSDDPA